MANHIRIRLSSPVFGVVAAFGEVFAVVFALVWVVVAGAAVVVWVFLLSVTVVVGFVVPPFVSLLVLRFLMQLKKN